MEQKPVSGEATGSRQQAAENEPVEAVIGRPPEAEASENPVKAQKRIARLEALRQWMLILAPLLLIGGYVADRLPVLYASALPLTVALIVTYRIKHLEERAEKEEVKSKK